MIADQATTPQLARPRRGGRVPGPAGVFLGLCLLAAGGAALAEVTLTTTVHRVVVLEDVQGPAREMLEAATTVRPGDVLRYTIVFENASGLDVAAGSVVITNPLPEGTEYIDGSARGESTLITFSVNGSEFAEPPALYAGEGEERRVAAASDYRSIRWTYQEPLPAGASGRVSFDLRML